MNIELLCPYCQFSKTVPPEKIPKGARWATCPRCGQRFDFAKTASAQAAREGANGFDGCGAAWEKRSQLGFWAGIAQTLKAVLFTPAGFFRHLPSRAGLREPLAFGLLAGTIGSMFGFFWQILMVAGGMAFFGQSFLGRITVGLIFFILLLVIPLLVAAGLFVTSGIAHICLRLVGAGKSGFEATFRVMAYSQAAQTWGLIPFFGGWIGWIWRLVIQLIGLREIHRISYPRLILAALIPVAFGVLVMAALLVSLFTADLRPLLQQV